MKGIRENIKYLALVLLIVIFTCSVVPRTFQNDTFYSIAIGQNIIENGMQEEEQFSWHDGLKYNSPHWLFDYTIGLIYNGIGLDGIYIFVCAVASIFMLIIFFQMVNKGIYWVLAYCATIVMTYLIKDGVFTARAHLISYMLFFVEYMLIDSFVKKRKFYKGLLLFIISLIIVNVHLAVWPMFFMLFLPYLVEYLFERYSILECKIRENKKLNKKLKELENVEGKATEKEKIKNNIETNLRIINKEKEARESKRIILEKNDNCKYLFIVMIICILAGFLTPTKLLPFTYSIKTIIGNTTQYILEHQATIIGTSESFLFVAILLIGMVAVDKTKIKLHDVFLLLGVTLMAIISNRHIGFFVIYGIFVFTKIINKTIKVNTEINISSELKNKINKILFMILFFTILAFSVYFFIRGKDDDYIDERLYPVKQAEYIKENLDLENIRLYNQYNYGAYLLYQGIPVFIDSRADLYSPEFNAGQDVFTDSMEANMGKITYTKVFEKYKITHAIVSKYSIVYQYLVEDPNVELLSEDDNFAVYKNNRVY